MPKVWMDYLSYLLRLWRCGLVFLVLAASLAWAPAWPAAAPAPQTETAHSSPLTLRVSLTNSQPVTLDPATASGDAAWMLLEQILAGLVDLSDVPIRDDQTGQLQPDLAAGWTVSPGGTVYTFTLRSDATWSDGQPVTAHDAAFGILRSLDPATNSASASLLYGIRNAQAYHQGQVTDPAEVGVAALDDTHLRVTLEHPASTILSILSHLVARPLPRHVVEAWGEDWTAPEHIVTSGPYRLAEWVPGDHLLLTKNPTYYGAAGVQIEQVLASRLDDATAWQRYLDGELDTARVPAGVILDPAQHPDVRRQPYPRAIYLGFSASQAPFDEPLVRQAFSAATNQWGLVRDVLAGPQQPALTFTPPGILGHVEDVGLPYDPAQARQWLADAGHPDGQGLPPITLWFPAGDEALAGYVQRQWAALLGVTVTLQSLPWEAYRAQVLTGQCQVWRGGWMADYGEAYNWLHDALALERSSFGGWTHAAYEDLVGQAAAEQDPQARTALYRQAEQVLVETEAIVIPLYADALLVAARPDLRRTYPGFGAPDVATWRLDPQRVLLPLVARSFSATPAPPADVIFHHGTLLTMEADRPQVQAIAIRGEHILAVGNDEEILALRGPATRVVDLAGRTLLPGFVDGHTHVLHHADDAGWTLDEAMQLLLSYGLTGVTEMSATWDFLDRLMAAEQAGRLQLRVNVFPRYNYPWLDESGHSLYEGVWFPGHLDPGHAQDGQAHVIAGPGRAGCAAQFQPLSRALIPHLRHRCEGQPSLDHADHAAGAWSGQPHQGQRRRRVLQRRAHAVRGDHIARLQRVRAAHLGDEAQRLQGHVLGADLVGGVKAPLALGVGRVAVERVVGRVAGSHAVAAGRIHDDAVPACGDDVHPGVIRPADVYTVALRAGDLKAVLGCARRGWAGIASTVDMHAVLARGAHAHAVAARRAHAHAVAARRVHVHAAPVRPADIQAVAFRAIDLKAVIVVARCPCAGVASLVHPHAVFACNDHGHAAVARRAHGHAVVARIHHDHAV